MHIINKINRNDVFIAFNLLLFLFMCIIAYYDRFITYRGRGNIYEFMIYALLIVAVLGVGWWYFRRFDFPVSLLLLIQFGILVHYTGGLFSIDGNRLYDIALFNIPYDKIVHFLNSFVAATFVHHFFNQLNVHLPKVRGLAILLIILGLGAIVEMVEYIVLLTIPGAGVGGYENNMLDLFANFLGCLLFLSFKSLAAVKNRWKISKLKELVS